MYIKSCEKKVLFSVTRKGPLSVLFVLRKYDQGEIFRFLGDHGIGHNTIFVTQPNYIVT